MTPRERVIAAVQHQETDYLPYSLQLYGEAYQRMVDYYGGEANFPPFVDHLAYSSAWGFPRERQVSEFVVQDAFGVQWDRTMDKGVGAVGAPLFSEDTFEQYVFPTASDPAFYAHLASFAEENRHLFTILRLGLSYFERSWTLYGMENILMDMLASPSLVERIYEKILAFNMEVLAHYVQFDVDCVHINDDWGQQKGLIMGPANWRRFIKPGLTAMVARVKAGGKYAYVHSCGDVAEIIPDLIEIGVDILNPFQPEAMDVFALKREYGKDITFHGGISQQRTLALLTPDDVEREMREAIPRLGKGGGYILAPSQEITTDTPPANVARFIEVALAQ